MAAVKQRQPSWIPVVNSHISMVCKSEIKCFALFRVQSVLVCLLLWFRAFTMAENSLVDSKFKGMPYSVPVNPLNHLHIEQPAGHLFTDLFTHRQKFNPLKNPVALLCC